MPSPTIEGVNLGGWSIVTNTFLLPAPNTKTVGARRGGGAKSTKDLETDHTNYVYNIRWLTPKKLIKNLDSYLRVFCVYKLVKCPITIKPK